MKAKQARALVDLSLYGCQAGHILETDAKVIDALVAAGHADDAKAAIKAAVDDGATVNRFDQKAEAEATEPTDPDAPAA